MLSLSPTSFNVLEALSVYRYLTPAQMLAVGVTRDKSHLYDTLKRLSRQHGAPVGKMDFGVVPKLGRLAVVYYLKAKGAEIIAEALRVDSTDIPYAKAKVMYHNDYFHRRDCVDFQITARQWAQEIDADMAFYHSYYDHTGANRGGHAGKLSPKTRVWTGTQALVPDGVFKIIMPDNIQRLFVMELSRGMDTKRVVNQLQTHLFALEKKAFSTAFDYPHHHRIVWVFDTENALKVVQERAASLPDCEKWLPAVFFKTIADIEQGFFEGWRGMLPNSPIKPLF